MSVTQAGRKSVEERIVELAEAGLKLHVRPISHDTSGIACRLFDLDTDCERKERALKMLEASYKGTPVSNLGPHDARIFRRERERRVKQLNAMLAERSKLVLHYGHELIESPLRHPELAEYYDALSV